MQFIVFVVALAFGVLPNSLLPDRRLCRFSCILLKSYSFIFAIRSLNHLELIFIDISYESQLISKGI